MSAPPHPRHEIHAPPNLRLTKPPQQPRRSHQLALYNHRCTHQAVQTLSEIVAIAEHWNLSQKLFHEGKSAGELKEVLESELGFSHQMQRCR
jgi:hypothetical protein